ncbi:MAG: DTW domain-containing protein [Pseudomonadales bacterium]|nr:DTW domain-containing protein [Pseudomonadales bacterium]
MTTPSHFDNAVLALRNRELGLARKPFRARGSKVKRCELCLLPVPDCICADRPLLRSKAAFCFILYTGEAFKPSNTGRLIADICPDSHAFVWDRTSPDPALLALLEDPDYSPIVVFPTQYASPERCLLSPQQAPGVSGGRKPLYVILDGTWREARKMFKSPCLQNFPVLGVEPENVSGYQLRVAAHEYQLCTAETGIELLRLAGEQDSANALNTYFLRFRQNYLAGKPSLSLARR